MPIYWLPKIKCRSKYIFSFIHHSENCEKYLPFRELKKNTYNIEARKEAERSQSSCSIPCTLKVVFTSLFHILLSSARDLVKLYNPVQRLLLTKQNQTKQPKHYCIKQYEFQFSTVIPKITFPGGCFHRHTLPIAETTLDGYILNELSDSSEVGKQSPG